jgi:hypothetical protein
MGASSGGSYRPQATGEYGYAATRSGAVRPKVNKIGIRPLQSPDNLGQRRRLVSFQSGITKSVDVFTYRVACNKRNDKDSADHHYGDSHGYPDRSRRFVDGKWLYRDLR